MRNFIKQFFCEHEYEQYLDTHYATVIDWFKCKKCRHVIRGMQ